jgi:hypothetical protein
MGSDGQGVGLRNRTSLYTLPVQSAMLVSGRLHSGGPPHPHQFSGNGISGQTSWLSFAANAGWSKLGARAILTTSSNRSNSTSSVAHSKCAGTMIVRIAIFPKNYPRAITGFDYVLFIAARGREIGTFSTKLWLNWSAPAFTAHSCQKNQTPSLIGSAAGLASQIERM